MYLKAEKDKRICQNCNLCQKLVSCPADFKEENCVGCAACFLACPFEAVKMVKIKREKEIEIEVNGKKFKIPEKITVKKALEELGLNFEKFPGYGIFVPCEVGGCYCCALEINGEIKPICITPVKEGIKIKTDLPENFIPKRVVGGFMGHTVGGVGTPWYLKNQGYIEVVVFVSGCNFRCLQCQNWTITFSGKETQNYFALTPQETAQIMTRVRRKFRVDRIAISGGECTLNRKWLVEYLRELKKLNPDEKARLHVDTNGSLLTPDYLDELIEAGMTDIGIDLKALNIESFMRITGLKDEKLAQKYKDTAWQAVKYLIENYKGKVFLGIGIPYNKKLISLEEIEAMGKEIFKIDPEVQVCVLDYRPEFRRRDIKRPTFTEMEKVYKILKDVGLKTVICQTQFGHIGP
jgi:pyruvate formate lyase activating enzyme